MPEMLMIGIAGFVVTCTVQIIMAGLFFGALSQRIKTLEGWVAKNDKTNERLAVLESKVDDNSMLMDLVTRGQNDLKSMVGKLLDRNSNQG